MVPGGGAISNTVLGLCQSTKSLRQSRTIPFFCSFAHYVKKGRA